LNSRIIAGKLTIVKRGHKQAQAKTEENHLGIIIKHCPARAKRALPLPLDDFISSFTNHKVIKPHLSMTKIRYTRAICGSKA
jgi:hypothetical protein